MKSLCLTLLLLCTTVELNAQKSEDFIPMDAVTVFSINNISLLQKIPLDELIKYEFMEDLQQELFDGSASGKTIKDAGIDFDQKFNVFYGMNRDYSVTGFSFGINDLSKLFGAFDDFDEVDSPYEGVQFYSSYFNHLMVRGNIGVLLRVDPISTRVYDISDSTWYARGYSDNRRYNYYDDYYEDDYEEIPETYDEDSPAIEMEEYGEDVYNVEEALEEIEESGDYIIEEDYAPHKNFYDLKDSIRTALRREYLLKVSKELFIDGQNLRKSDKVLAEQLTHVVEGVFYLDNERNILKTQPFSYYSDLMPYLIEDITSLYKNNKIVGDIRLKEHSIEANMTSNYGDALGTIYKELNSSKFDKKMTKYIHKDNSAYFTYNVDLGKAYEKTYEIIMPILKKEKSRMVSSSVLAIEMMNAFLDKDAIFDMYRGGMFGSFNGVKKVPVRKLVYEYDEDFNYIETETFEEQDIPIFTLGFSTNRNDIPAIFMEQMSNMNSEWQNMGKYWKIENAFLNSVPLFIINHGGMFIMTNDENLAVNNPDGFGANKLTRSQIKATKKSGFLYGQMNTSKIIDNIPRTWMTNKQIDMLNAMRTKSGDMQLTSSKTSISKTDFKLVYDFKGEYEDSGKHLLDLVNSLYVIMK